jgi:microcystin-dependent protein
MSEPYVGEIEIFAFNFAPKGWAQCNGQIMAIAQNQALFALLGTTYGGNGIQTFALPDLRSRIPVGQGNGQGLTPRSIGQMFGEENHTLLGTETPAHSHPLQAKSNPVVASNTSTPGPGVVLAQTNGVDNKGGPLPVNLYATDSAPSRPMAGSAISVAGGQPHPNLMPYLVCNACIALVGIFPSRN